MVMAEAQHDRRQACEEERTSKKGAGRKGELWVNRKKSVCYIWMQISQLNHCSEC